MKALRSHEHALPDYVSETAEKANLPQSEIVPDDVYQWMEDRKPFLATVETDIRDARRRVQLVKGPKKKQQTDQPAGSTSEDNEEGASDVEGWSIRTILVTCFNYGFHSFVTYDRYNF